MVSSGYVRLPLKEAPRAPGGKALSGRRQLPPLQLDFQAPKAQLHRRPPALTTPDSAYTDAVGGDEDKVAPSFQDAYTLGQVMGSGTTSVVRRCIRKSDGQVFAVKCVTAIDDEMRQFTRDEYELVKSLRHPAIITFRLWYESPASALIVMDMCSGGSLESFTRQHGPADEFTAQQLSCQLFRGVNYLHHKRVVHRDLKPANLLLQRASTAAVPPVSPATPGATSSNWQLKISDFNSAKRVGKANGLLLTDRGTQLYTAPELRFGRLWNERIDIWACGMCVYYMLKKHVPFDICQKQVADTLLTGELPCVDWHEISANAGNLIRQCLVVDPADRPTAMILLVHPFISMANITGTGSPVHRAASIDSPESLPAMHRLSKDSKDSASSGLSEPSERTSLAAENRTLILASCGILTFGSRRIGPDSWSRRAADLVETEEQLQRMSSPKQSDNVPAVRATRSDFSRPPASRFFQMFGESSGSTSRSRGLGFSPNMASRRRAHSMYLETPTAGAGEKLPRSPQQRFAKAAKSWKEPRSFDVLLRLANQKFVVASKDLSHPMEKSALHALPSQQEAKEDGADSPETPTSEGLWSNKDEAFQSLHCADDSVPEEANLQSIDGAIPATRTSEVTCWPCSLWRSRTMRRYSNASQEACTHGAEPDHSPPMLDLGPPALE